MEDGDFVQKYGAVKVQFISSPPKSVFFTKPFALNYFHGDKLYRTANERSSGKLELFLDLLYVGIVASIAEPASERATGAALLEYCILFVPIFSVWLDVTFFMNYYFNDDLTQRLTTLWITVLLMIYANNARYVLEGVKYAAMCVVPYMLCRLTVAAGEFFYSKYIMEHRLQLRLNASLVFITTPIWISVIFVGTKAKVGISIALLAVEQMCFSAIAHPAVKRRLHVTHGTALNIEHLVERFASFYIIAIGEFLFTIVSGHPAGEGIHVKMWKAVLILIIGFSFMWLYFNGDGSARATHALRRSAFTSLAWIYLHVVLIGTLILSADSAAELLKLEEVNLMRNEYEDEELSLYGLSFYFTGNIAIALWAISLLALCDKPDPEHEARTHISQLYRVLPRFPIALIILCLSFAELKPVALIGLTTLMMVLLFTYEILFALDSSGNCNSGIGTVADAGSGQATASSVTDQNENDFLTSKRSALFEA